MLNLWPYLILSVFETSAMFFLSFKIFKIDLFLKEIIFASLMMGFISYILRNDYQLDQVDIVLQYVLMICFLWLLFRIHIFYAAIMTGMGYQAYLLIQTSLYSIMDRIGISFDNFQAKLSVYTLVLQALSALTAILIGIYIGKKRKGFDFVPDKPNGKIYISSRDKILFALNIPSVLILISAIYLANYFPKWFFLESFAYALVLYGYLYISYKKDRSNDENFGL
ncbi:hypothetical protein J2T13_002955 [Paenibacillus sp. DS2015]|uniref:hypothetical protein n=1 Tax=Paenibacillus sp. DS2015 TaxID=3373917 RepID=UPI003D194DB0